jgi:hypothetical protein
MCRVQQGVLQMQMQATLLPNTGPGARNAGIKSTMHLCSVRGPAHTANPLHDDLHCPKDKKATQHAVVCRCAFAVHVRRGLCW